MAEQLDVNTIERLGRAIFGQLSELGGTRSTGTLTVTATAGGGAQELPRNSYLVPVVDSRLREKLVFKVAADPATLEKNGTGGDWTISESGTVVDIQSNFGGKRHNLPAGTRFRFMPPIAGIEQEATLATALTGGTDTLDGSESLVKGASFFEDLNTANAQRDMFSAKLGKTPALMLVWLNSTTVEGRTSGLRQGATRGRRQVRFYRETYVLYVIVCRSKGDEDRRNAGLTVMQAITRLITDRQCNDDGEQLTTIGGGVDITDRSRTLRGPNSYVYAVRMRLNQTVRPLDRRTFSQWLRTNLKMALPGRPAPEPGGAYEIVDVDFEMPAVTVVLIEGNSYVEGLRPDIGGYRVEMLTPGLKFVGTERDPVSRLHGGIGGQNLNVLEARFVDDWERFPAKEVWPNGGTNDIAVDLQPSSVAEADMVTYVTTVTNTVPAGTVTRLDTVPPMNSAADVTLTDFNLRLQRVANQFRADGHRVFLHDGGGNLSAGSGDLDGIPLEHPIQGTVYGLEGVGTGYKKWGAYKDRYFDASLAKAPHQVTSATRAAHFRFDQVDVTDGRITRARDLSGLDRHADESGGSGPMLVVGSDFGRRRAAADFDGVANFLRTAVFLRSQPSYVWMVLGPVGGTQQTIFDSADVNDRHLFWSSASGLYEMFAGSFAPDPYVLATNCGNIVAVGYDTTSSIMRIMGNPRRGASYSPGNDDMGGITLGASAAGTPLFHARVRMYEIAFFDGIPNEADRYGLDRYGASYYKAWPDVGE